MVTQRCIAEKLGVSRRLVAYALNGNGRMGDETRQKIRTEAERMGYRPNRAAQALITGRNYQIALCFPFLGSSFYNEIIRQFEILTRETPYDLLMVACDPEITRGSDLEYTADGSIFIGPPHYISASMVRPVIALHLGLQEFEDTNKDKFDRVQIDIADASRAAMEHLMEQGFRRIAYVATSSMMRHHDFRYYFYQEAMEKAGLPMELITITGSCEELIRRKSHEALIKHFEENGLPDALFCCNDDISMGAYRALNQIGRKIPDETAVLGFDDLDDSQYLTPPLSSVQLSIEDACRKAWNMLMLRLEDKTLPPQFEAVEAHLVVRESSSGKSKTA